MPAPQICFSYYNVTGIIVKSYIILWAEVGRILPIIKSKQCIGNKIAKLVIPADVPLRLESSSPFLVDFVLKTFTPSDAYQIPMIIQVAFL